MTRTQLIAELGQLLTLQCQPNVAETRPGRRRARRIRRGETPRIRQPRQRGASCGIDDEADVVSVDRHGQVVVDWLAYDLDITRNPHWANDTAARLLAASAAANKRALNG